MLAGDVGILLDWIEAEATVQSVHVSMYTSGCQGLFFYHRPYKKNIHDGNCYTIWSKYSRFTANYPDDPMYCWQLCFALLTISTSRSMYMQMLTKMMRKKLAKTKHGSNCTVCLTLPFGDSGIVRWLFAPDDFGRIWHHSWLKAVVMQEKRYNSTSKFICHIVYTTSG